MPLLTTEIKEKLPPLYSQENTADPLALVRFYDTLGDWSWYVIEFDGENLFFGLVFGFESELGYFSLAEFEQLNREAGFARIERDEAFEPTPISAIQR
jgi:hypothetical protein